jgi:hypothetical protein
MNDMAFVCEDAVADAGGPPPMGRRVAQPPPAPERQQRLGLQAAGRSRRRSGRQVFIPFPASMLVSPGGLAPRTLSDGAATAPSFRRCQMGGSIQGLTLPLREGPAWPGSQPAAGTAQGCLAGRWPIQISEGI